jgi:Flp pilus assembly protein TadG
MFQNLLNRTWKDESGSESVEFSLSLMGWIGGAFLIMYGSFAIYAAHFVANASDEAARYAIVRGSSWNGASCSTNSGFDCTATSSDIETYVEGTLPPGLSAANLTVTTAWPGTTSSGATCDTEDGANSPNCQVQVQVTYNFSFPVPFFPQSRLPLTSSAAMTISQ